MSHIVYTSNGEKLRKRDIVDDLKEFIQRYEFYDDEVHRLWKDYEELEAENKRLKEMNTSLLLSISNKVWLEINHRLKPNHRRWRNRRW